MVDGDDDYFSTCLRLYPRIDTEIRKANEQSFDGSTTQITVRAWEIISIDYFSICIIFQFVINDSIMCFTEILWYNKSYKISKIQIH